MDLKHLKITMKMDVLRCETVAGVLKELAVFALAYNLVRSVMGESARRQGVAPERVSFVDAVRWLIGCEAGRTGSRCGSTPRGRAGRSRGWGSGGPSSGRG